MQRYKLFLTIKQQNVIFMILQHYIVHDISLVPKVGRDSKTFALDVFPIISNQQMAPF